MSGSQAHERTWTVAGSGEQAIDASLAQAIFHSLPNGIVVQDLDGKIVWANPAAEMALGLTTDQLRGITSIDPAWRAVRANGDNFPGDEHPAMVALREGHTVRDVVMGVFNPKANGYTWINVNAVPIRDAASQSVQGVYSTFQDITRQRQIEGVLRDRDAEFRMAVQSSSDGFWIADLSGRLVDVNDAYVKMSGYSREELLTLCVADIDQFDHAQEVAARMQRIITNGIERFVSEHRTKDQRRFPVEVVASYTPTSGGHFYCFIKDLTEQQKSAELIWHQANFDRLTDLPSRDLFFDRLSQECSAARRNGKQVALLFADLDAFKPVNDQFGHDAGDVVLQTVASRWLACVRDTDTVARLGGDEFAIIAGNLDSSHEAIAIVRKIIASLEPAIALPRNHDCRVGVSIGIAMYPTNGLEMDSLVAAADAAMYVSKKCGKNRFSLSDAATGSVSQGVEWMEFNESHLVGVAEIDGQHRQLVHLINRINQLISGNGEQSQVYRLLDELMTLTVHHFQTEHRLMLEHGFPNAHGHDQEHSRLVRELRHLIRKNERDGELLVLQKIKNWLIAHIHSSDKELGQYLTQKGVH